MSGASNDFKSAFRAAKAARDGGKLTKEQLRAMKVQKAATLAQQAEEAAAARARSSEEDARSMPPPPPRASTAARQHPAASYHADSQATRIQEGGEGFLPQSEPSVNNALGARSLRTSPDTANNALSAVGSSGLPAGFFEAAASVGEVGGTAGAPPPTPALSGEAAHSAEGSTVGVGGGRGAANGADLATSALRSLTKPQGAAPSAALSIAETGTTAQGQAEAHNGMRGSPPDVASTPRDRTEESAAPAQPAATASSAQAALPVGFFADAAADAKARGVAPKKKKAAEIEKELAAFMAEVETDAAAAAVAAAAADEDDTEARQDRDDFEHFVRKERLRELREVSHRSSAREPAPTPGLASALELAGIQPEAPPPPPVRLPKRRRVAETLARLATDWDESDDEGEGGEEELVDWRAKQSTR